MLGADLCLLQHLKCFKGNQVTPILMRKPLASHNGDCDWLAYSDWTCKAKNTNPTANNMIFHCSKVSRRQPTFKQCNSLPFFFCLSSFV